MNKVRKLKNRQDKASSLVEFIIIAPILIIMLLFTWQIFKTLGWKNALINTARYAVWEKVDYVRKDGSFGTNSINDPRPNQAIQNDILNLYDFDQSNFLMNLNDKSSVSLADFGSIGNIDSIGSFSAGMKSFLSGALDTMIWASVGNLSLNKHGLWQIEAAYQVDFPGTLLNQIITSNEQFENTYNLVEHAMLLTDAWYTPDPKDNDPNKGISFGGVRDRLSGYWLTGPIPLPLGNISSKLTSLLEYELKLGFFGNYPLCQEQPPRVNLESVPDRV